MLLSLIIVVSVPAAAVDGMWTVYTRPSYYEEGEDGEPAKPRVWGYTYTEEGFTTIAPDWTEQCPFGTVQSRDPVNIEDGIYMEFRIDKYDYTANDMWIDVSFWDSQNISPGSAGYGQGLQTLIRPTKATEENPQSYFSDVQWFIREWSNGGKTAPEDGSKLMVEEDGTVVFKVELINNGGTYTLTINGAKAPDGVMSYFAKTFADGEAYVGITLHNTKVSSEVGLTITKFGTSKETATVPQGDDSVDPLSPEIEEKAPIADPSTVPEGMPAIFMTGDKTNSDTRSYGAAQGDTDELNDDYSVRFIDTNDDIWSSNTWHVKNEVSYDIDDFPVMCFLTRDFCTCDDPADCYATEACKIYLMTGEDVAAGGNNSTPEIDICWEPIVVEEGEHAGTYLYFWYDSGSDIAKEVFDPTGRIHSVRLDFSSLVRDAGRNVITIEWVAFFRSVDDIEPFINSYLELDAEGDTTEAPAVDTTEAPVVDTTEAPAVDTTEAPAVDTTEAPVVDQTEVKTDDKVEDKTDAPKGDDKTDDKTDDNKGGDNTSSSNCKSVIGAGAVAVIAMVVTCGAVVLRKKED